MWRASFIPNISLIAKDGKEPLKFIVTLSFLPVYSIAIVKAVNLANCWKQVTRIAPRASDESPKKWPKNKKIRTEASELTEACILSAHRLFLKLWKLLEGSSSCQIFRSTEMVLDWRGIQLSNAAIGWVMKYHGCDLWKFAQTINMYFMNVETTSIYETRGYPHLCAYFVISNIISNLTNPPIRKF